MVYHQTGLNGITIERPELACRYQNPRIAWVIAADHVGLTRHV